MPPTPVDRIANAGGDARAEQRRNDDVGIVGDLVLALNDMNPPLGPHSVVHDSFPTTASIAPRSWATVNGLVM